MTTTNRHGSATRHLLTFVLTLLFLMPVWAVAQPNSDASKSNSDASQPNSEAAKPTGEEVTFGSGGLTLAGTLYLPQAEGPHPVVVTISGSGPQTRNAEVPGVPGYELFADLAAHLTEGGLAVLSYDDRGVGASEGDNATATSADLAEDAEAALAFLAGRSDIDSSRIGLLGHSEGAMIAPMIASRNQGVAFVISLAPPVGETLEGLVLQERRMLESVGLPPEAVEEQVAMTREALELTRAEEWDDLEALLHETVERQLAALPPEQQEQFGDPEQATEMLVGQTMTQYQGWMHYFLEHDSRADWQRMDVPALAVFAELDVQVVPEYHRSALEQVADEEQVTIVTLPGTNHLFQEAQSGGLMEYGQLPPDPSARLLEAIDGWLERNVLLSD